MTRPAFAVLVVLALAVFWPAPAGAAPWLFVTDIHLEPGPDGRRPGDLRPGY